VTVSRTLTLHTLVIRWLMRRAPLLCAIAVAGAACQDKPQTAPTGAPPIVRSDVMAYDDSDVAMTSCRQFGIARCPQLHVKNATHSSLLKLLGRINNEYNPDDKSTDYALSKIAARDRKLIYGGEYPTPGDLEGACATCPEPDEILSFASTINKKTSDPGDPIDVTGRIADIRTAKEPGWTVVRLITDQAEFFVAGWFATNFVKGQQVEALGYQAEPCSYQGVNTNPTVHCIAAVALTQPNAVKAVEAAWKKERRRIKPW
jgi:hypothetical protein